MLHEDEFELWKWNGESGAEDDLSGNVIDIIHMLTSQIESYPIFPLLTIFVTQPFTTTLAVQAFSRRKHLKNVHKEYNGRRDTV